MVVTKKRLSAAFDTELPVLLRSFLPEEVVRASTVMRPPTSLHAVPCGSLVLECGAHRSCSLWRRAVCRRDSCAATALTDGTVGLAMFECVCGSASAAGPRWRGDERGDPLHSPVRRRSALE